MALGPRLRVPDMITNRDLRAIDATRARALVTACESVPTMGPDDRERLAAHLQEAALNRLVRVTLRLSGLAGCVDDQTRTSLVAAVEEIDAAVRAARDVVFAESAAPQPPAPIATVAQRRDR